MYYILVYIYIYIYIHISAPLPPQGHARPRQPPGRPKAPRRRRRWPSLLRAAPLQALAPRRRRWPSQCGRPPGPTGEDTLPIRETPILVGCLLACVCVEFSIAKQILTRCYGYCLTARNHMTAPTGPMSLMLHRRKNATEKVCRCQKSVGSPTTRIAQI